MPNGARAVAADVAEELCQAVLCASASATRGERAWKLLLLRERLLFLAPLQPQFGHRRGDNEERLDKSCLVRERAGALLCGEWTGLLAETRRSACGLTRSREKDGAAQGD